MFALGRKRKRCSYSSPHSCPLTLGSNCPSKRIATCNQHISTHASCERIDRPSVYRGQETFTNYGLHCHFAPSLSFLATLYSICGCLPSLPLLPLVQEAKRKDRETPSKKKKPVNCNWRSLPGIFLVQCTLEGTIHSYLPAKKTWVQTHISFFDD